MERATGVALFPIIVDVAGSTVNIDALWRQIEGIPHPGQPPAFSTPTVQASQAAKSAGSANRNRVVAAISAFAGLPSPLPFWFFVGGIVAFFAFLKLLDKTDVVRGFEVARNTSLARWAELQRHWQERTASASGASAFR